MTTNLIGNVYVDPEIADYGEGIQEAIRDLFQSDVDTPGEIREIFEVIFASECVRHGYYQDADGAWHRLPMEVPS